MNNRTEQLKKNLHTSRKNIINTQKEVEDLTNDKEQAGLARLGLVKLENNQPITTEEQEAITEIKDNYPTFFDEEMEESDTEMTTSPEYKERKMVSEVIKYLSGEIKSSSDKLKTHVDSWNKTKATLQSILATTSSGTERSETNVVAEGSGTRAKPDTIKVEEGEKSKEEIKVMAEPSNKQISQTPGDYIDNLPKEHNPFDDIGGED